VGHILDWTQIGKVNFNWVELNQTAGLVDGYIEEILVWILSLGWLRRVPVCKE